MALLADQADRDRLAEELDSSFLCLAGAGAGKTHELVERMVACVAAGVAPVEAMAAITFTRKAAGELRGRFFLGLRARAAATAGRRGARLAAAVARIDHCYIGTIHSFCAALLRQHPLEAGLSPDFAEVEERDEAQLLRSSWDRFVEARAGAGDLRLERLAELGLMPEDLFGFFRRRSQYTDLPLKPTEAARPNLEAEWARLVALVEAAGPRLPAPGSRELDPFGELVRRTEPLLAFGGALSDGERAAVLGEFSRPSATHIIFKRWPAAEGEYARQLRDEDLPALRAAFEPVLTAWRQHVYATVAPLVDEAAAEYGEDRRAVGLVTFQDLLERTAALLAAHRSVRRRLRERYRVLFVDEFQDTDPLQAEIALRLTAAGDGRGWQELAPRPGSLFVVGDEKQSIYRFRRADVEVFRRVRDRIAAGEGAVARLTTSFRARPALCAWLNSTFAPLFAGDDETVQAPFEPLAPARHETASGPAVWALRHERRTGGIGRARHPVAAADAGRIADYIAAAVSGQVAAGDGPLPVEGPPSPGDFMVLTRTTGALATYARALEARGLAYDISGGSSLRQAPELSALIELLEAAARPDDAVALLAYLRGYLVGLADDELAALRRAGGPFDQGPWPPGDAGALSGELRARLEAAFGRLDQARQWLRELTPAAAIERLVVEGGLLAFAAAAEAGSSRAGSLVRLLALVQQWQAAGRLAHWGAALDELRGLRDDEAYRFEEMTLEIGQPDAVRLMNLHQAKGLEAPVVFLADPCDTAAARRGPDTHVSRLGDRPYLAMAVSRRRGAWGQEVIAEPAGWAQDAAREGAFAAAEELRLVYVAATRARDALVVATYEAAPEAGPWCCLYPALRSAPDLPALEAGPGTAAEVPEPDREAMLAAAAARWQAARRSTRRVRPVTDAAGEAEIEVAVEGARGRGFGTLVHRLFEAAVGGRVSLEAAAELRAWVADQAAELGVDEALEEGAAAALQAFGRSAVWAELATASQVFSEVPFGLLDEAGAEAVVVRGVIDLAYRTAPGWTIVDYKTERPGGADPAAALRERYGDQVRAYARYWRRLTGEPVVAALLWTPELGSVECEK